MFGYLVADTGQLTPEQLSRYKACYCGLCHSLRERHGELSRLTLNYDLTFLVLLLSSLYEPEEKSAESCCIVHPVKPRPFWQSEFTGYAADMNVALAYLKCMDNWRDDFSMSALACAGLLKSGYERVCGQYPEQCGVIRESMERLHSLEDNGTEDADAAAECFGTLMGGVLSPKKDRWGVELNAMGRALGRFIYVMDACMDLDGDVLNKRYNPFRSYYGRSDNEQRFRDIMKMLLGDAVMHFDRLPLVQDVGLMKNIMCAGLWAQFNRKFAGRKGHVDGTGPI